MKHQILPLLLVLFIAVGCNDGRLATVAVTGTVTFNGQPLAGATVNFAPTQQDQGHMAYAITDENGHYRLQTAMGNPGAGTTPGEYNVTFRKMSGVEQGEYVPSAESVSHVGPVVRPRSLIPERYGTASGSGITATVVPRGSNVFDFDLTE
ncbi:MAG: carboxypeptidase-like regulatory domain-containing protein [Planctomycetaceae bacterium]|nr:carboxypeptidase-like regulatory domain-containing protein [Planctomycetaceae bacterium]